MTLEILKIIIVWCSAQDNSWTGKNVGMRECTDRAFKCVDRIENPSVTARQLFQQCLDKK